MRPSLVVSTKKRDPELLLLIVAWTQWKKGGMAKEYTTGWYLFCLSTNKGYGQEDYMVQLDCFDCQD